jgi:hypothetical protein
MYNKPPNTPEAGNYNGSTLAVQYDLNKAVLGRLGFDQQEIEEQVPSLEAIDSALRPNELGWINQQTAAGYAAKLVIAPSVQSIGLVGMRYAPGLLPRFDIEQPKRADTRVSKAWLSIGDMNPIHDNGFSGRFSAAILLEPIGDMLISDAEGMAADGALSNDQLLRSTASVDAKTQALRKNQSEQAGAGRRVVSATISQLVVREAMARYTGQRSFQHKYSTGLPHYPVMKGGSRGSIPTLSRGGRHNKRLVLSSRMLFVADEAIIRAMDIQPNSPDVS